MDALTYEIDRLRAFFDAIIQHSHTYWPNTTMGMGGVGGQAITTKYHPHVVDFLASQALAGVTLKEAADTWDNHYPGSARLDEHARPARRRGPDGRPV